MLCSPSSHCHHIIYPDTPFLKSDLFEAIEHSWEPIRKNPNHTGLERSPSTKPPTVQLSFIHFLYFPSEFQRFSPKNENLQSRVLHIRQWAQVFPDILSRPRFCRLSKEFLFLLLERHHDLELPSPIRVSKSLRATKIISPIFPQASILREPLWTHPVGFSVEWNEYGAPGVTRTPGTWFRKLFLGLFFIFICVVI